MIQSILSKISQEAEYNFESRIKLLQLEGVDIGAYWGGRIILAVLITLFFGIILMCVSLASAVFLGQVLGGLAYGLLSVGLFFLISIPILWFARKRLFIRPIIRWIVGKLDDHEIAQQIHSRSSLKIMKGILRSGVEASNRNLRSQFSHLQEALQPEHLGFEAAKAIQQTISKEN